MKRYLPIIAIILIFVAGLGILCYPLISSVANNATMRSVALEKQEEVMQMDTTVIDALFAEAEKYNDSLLNTVILTDPFDEAAYEAIGALYEETFNVDSEGLIGYIDIPKINVYLPIYHGTSTEVLEHGAGHLENTSLPIGGESTHSVISAHTAFPTETFFDYLTDMEEGDAFYVHVLNRTLKYEVDQIKVVLPVETSDLHVIRGEDHVTLLTCTPYSINSHRLLVRGKRVPYIPEEEKEQAPGVLEIESGALFFMGYKISYVTAAIVIAVFLLFVGGTVFTILHIRKKHKRVAKKDGGTGA